MNCNNSAKRLFHDILVYVTRAFIDNSLVETIDRIPIMLRPLGSETSRCCIYKSRALIKYRTMSVLGYGMDDEHDELTPLSEYARGALSRRYISEKIFSIIDPACSGCLKGHFHITDACKGCMARPCMINCPKQCIFMLDGQAKIEYSSCINCGRCQKVCPYHAIIRIPIPCEEACPVSAIKKDDSGRTSIDFSRCIYCGKCVEACPFGAIVERSQVVDILRALGSGRRIYALVAPAIAGQFEGGFFKVISALKRIGFYAVEEVAFGAEKAAEGEAKEFSERRAKGMRFMTTSCCSAYVQATRKVIPSLLPFVSGTPSPMQLIASSVKSCDKAAVTVFIGPCVAKRREVVEEKKIDYYLTFTELAALFDAHKINILTQPDGDIKHKAGSIGRGFPLSGGVASAILANLRDEEASGIKVVNINGLNERTLKQLEKYALEGCDADLIEVMNCEGGCVNGPAVCEFPEIARKRLEGFYR